MAIARRMCWRWRGRASWLAVSSLRMAPHPSPGRSSTLSSIECDTVKLRGQRLGRGGDQLGERVLRPRHVPAGRRLLPHHLAPLLGVVARLGQRPLVLDHVLGGLRPHVADRVEPGPPRPPGDLVELAGGEQPRRRAVVLAELGEQHRADRHVDAHAEGVGAADDLEVALLGEALDHAPVLGEHARVVDADAVAHQRGERLAEPRAEAEVAQRLADGVLLGPAGDVDADQGLRPLDRRLLGEVHDVDRRPVGGQQVVDRLVHGRVPELEVERHRAGGVADRGGGPAGPLGELGLEPAGVAERRRHQQELGLGQREQRHLPGPAPVGVGVVVELVDDHLADVGLLAVAQRQVGEDLGRAAITGRRGLTAASPVSIPTLSDPSSRHRSKNFSDTSALIGAV